MKFRDATQQLAVMTQVASTTIQICVSNEFPTWMLFVAASAQVNLNPLGFGRKRFHPPECFA